MAPSQVSGKKMRTLLFGVILGIFAVVHSVTSNVVSLDEIYREPETALPKRLETTEATQQPSFELESDMYEGSGGDNYNFEIQFPQHGSDHLESTPQSVEHNHSSQYPFTDSRESEVFEGSGGNNYNFEIQFPQHGSDHLESTPQSVEHNHSSQYPFTESKESDVFEGSGGDSYDLEIPQHGESTTQGGSPTQRPYTETTESTFEESLDFINFVPVNDSEGSGSGSVGSSDEGEMSPVSTTQTSSLTRNIAPRMPEINKPGPEVPQTLDPQTRKDTAVANQSTPGWIIIVAFIVGVAALVMLCVAIATRDKWNGPNQASKLETKTNSSNQQRELEMETFLQKDQPRENGEAAEYTVIQLDDLPDQHSSQ